MVCIVCVLLCPVMLTNTDELDVNGNGYIEYEVGKKERRRRGDERRGKERRREGRDILRICIHAQTRAHTHTHTYTHTGTERFFGEVQKHTCERRTHSHAVR